MVVWVGVRVRFLDLVAGLSGRSGVADDAKGGSGSLTRERLKVACIS